MPVNIPSPNRARAFLWLVYHYLEDPFSSGTQASSSSRTSSDTNPFSDDYAKEHPGMVPYLPMLNQEDMRARRENIDPPEEIEWGNQMCAQRTGFLQRLINNTETEKKIKNVFKPPGTSDDLFVLKCTFLMLQSSRKYLQWSNRRPFMADVNSSVVLTLAPTSEGRRPRAPRQVYEAEGGETFRHYAPQNASPRKVSNTSSKSLKLCDEVLSVDPVFVRINSGVIIRCIASSGIY